MIDLITISLIEYIIQIEIKQKSWNNFPAYLTIFSPCRDIFVSNVTQDIVKVGDKVYLPALAKSLRRIATGGVHEFYNGSLADDIVADIADAGE